MLFTHGKQSFQKLAKALEGYKIESAVIDIALEYLDISKERDNTFLDRIPRQNCVSGWNLLNAVERAVKSEILSARSEELKERFILLSEALFGYKSYEFLRVIYNYYGVERHEKEIVKALSSRYGDKAEAC
ncbi:MAG: hypothetical protein NC205_09715, partial [Prevotella sp.]|nr:hypothetical protein [Prevotella sp.]